MNRTAYADQFRAASRDAFGRLHTISHRTPDSYVDYAPLTPGSWLRDQAAGVVASVEAGSVEFCPHIGPSPQVAFAAAWAPGRIVCGACLPTLRLHGDDDTRCDRCGTWHPGINPRVVAFGPILFSYGHCDHCLNTG